MGVLLRNPLGSEAGAELPDLMIENMMMFFGLGARVKMFYIRMAQEPL